ncbi:hypothetical protein GQ53DRAFT_809200 [Thozetella sp. PMI_491]|nr:hypothetical protein GQ53DRAFT_809200 [Thozetella sp. PMI_491]
MKLGARTFIVSLVSLTLSTPAQAQERGIQTHIYQNYLATTIVTETVYAVCGIQEQTTLSSLCTTPTNLVLPGNAVLSGVTVHAASSPSSCYSLPTPTASLDAIPYQNSEQYFSDGESNRGDAQDPVLFYMAENATSPQYVSSTVNGSRILLDLSSEAASCGHIALAFPDGRSLVFNNAGMHLYHNGCSSVSSVSIANFTDQLTSIGALPDTPPCRREIFKRQVQETNFTVEVRVNTTSDPSAMQPNMTFGQSPCEFLSRVLSTDADICSWSCQVPGEFSKEKQCERSFSSWMNGTSGSSIPSPKNVSDLLDYMTPFLQKAGASIGNVFPVLTPLLNHVVPFLYTTQRAVANAINFGGMAICKLLHQNDEYDLVMLIAGKPNPYTVGAFVTPPDTTISANLVPPTTSPTREPGRTMHPGQTGFPLISILPSPLLSGLLTSAIPGLPTAGIPGLPTVGIPGLPPERVEDVVQTVTVTETQLSIPDQSVS